MSKTRIPANGKVGESGAAAVARLRFLEHLELKIWLCTFPRFVKTSKDREDRMA